MIGSECVPPIGQTLIGVGIRVCQAKESGEFRWPAHIIFDRDRDREA